MNNKKTTPISAEERRRIKARTKKKHDQLRRKYKEVRGKRVDWVDYSIEEDWLYVDIRFTDGTAFHLTFEIETRILVDAVELSDWSTGDGNILKKYD